MKYLKIFESLEDEIYSEFPFFDYAGLKDSYIPFASQEESKLEKLFGTSIYRRNNNIDVDDNGYYLEFKLNTGESYIYLVLRKLPDEWYIIRVVDTSDYVYKCDQWDGLVKCLKDKIFNEI